MANDNINYAKKIETLLDELPEFIRDFIYNFGSADSYITKFEYTKDILDYMRYIVNYIPDYSEKQIRELTIKDIENVPVLDINRYFTLLLGGGSDDGLKPNTVKRRRATLSSMYSFYNTAGLMGKNPVAATKPIKIPEKSVIYLTNDEQRLLLNTIMYGTNLPEGVAKKHNKYAERDTALFTLLLDTGLRVSEMLSSDIIDYDLKACSVIVRRKGGDMDTVYYSDECASYLADYFDSQRAKYRLSDLEIPAFTTLYGERLGVRATEVLVKKYIAACMPEKIMLITPHKLRSSFAMSFYEASDKDILLLQERMHHKSITTTNIYAKASKKDAEKSRNLLQNLRNGEG